MVEGCIIPRHLIVTVEARRRECRSAVLGIIIRLMTRQTIISTCRRRVENQFVSRLDVARSTDGHFVSADQFETGQPEVIECRIIPRRLIVTVEARLWKALTVLALIVVRVTGNTGFGIDGKETPLQSERGKGMARLAGEGFVYTHELELRAPMHLLEGHFLKGCAGMTVGTDLR